MLKKYDKSIQEYRKSIEASPNMLAYFNLGVVYWNIKEYKKSLIEFEIALKLNPNDRKIKHNVAKLRKILCLSNEEELPSSK